MSRPLENDYEAMLPYATPRQAQIVQAVMSEGTQEKAAKVLGISSRNVASALQRLKNNAAERGYSPENGVNSPTPPGYMVQGTSTLKNMETGQEILQWVKTKKAPQQIWDAWVEAIEEHCSGVRPAPKIKMPKKTLSDLLNLYTITDYHMGMLAYAPETGDDWDTYIARDVLLSAITEMAERSPDAETGVFCQLGDFLHFDSMEAVTPTSGHLLDADTRYGRLVDVTISSIIDCIEILARKHKKLIVVIAEGNHDMAGSVWLRKLLKQVYKNNKRIEIDDTEFPFYAYQHGEIMLGFHHGHKVTNKNLPSLFSSEPRYRQMWGECKYTYIHTGHYHKKEQDCDEHGGAVVERHQTLAGRDAYAARGGYVSRRAAQQITYHKNKGEDGRVVVYPDYPD